MTLKKMDKIGKQLKEDLLKYARTGFVEAAAIGLLNRGHNIPAARKIVEEFVERCQAALEGREANQLPHEIHNAYMHEIIKYLESL